MDDQAEEVVRALSVREPTEDELYYINWARDKAREELQLADDLARQLLTLSAVLFGTGLAFLTDKVINVTFLPWILGLFLGATLVAMLGTLPFQGHVYPTAPERIRQVRLQALGKKWACVRAAAGLFAAAVLLCFLGMIMR